MTWDHAQRHLDGGTATLVILSAEEVERLRAELGPRRDNERGGHDRA